MNMFNNKGEINASSLKDLSIQLQKYASVLEDNQPSNLGLSSEVSSERSGDLISRAIYTNEGKIALAQAMANPIRKNLDYHGVARKALVVDVLEQGEIPTYERDIDVAATVVSSNGTAPESRIFGDRITVPLFEIVSNPKVRIAEVKRRRFNLIDRAVQKSRQEIMAQEDANIFAALDAAASVENTLQDISDSGMLKRDLVELKAQVDRWDLVTAKYFMHINEFTDILKWGAGGGQGVRRRRLRSSNYERSTTDWSIWTYLGCRHYSKQTSTNSERCTLHGDSEFLGVMPVQQDIEVMPADEPKQLSLGWVVSEIIGIAIPNPRAVAAGRKSVTVG